MLMRRFCSLVCKLGSGVNTFAYLCFSERSGFSALPDFSRFFLPHSPFSLLYIILYNCLRKKEGKKEA